jgi:hypothetical protein
MDKLPFSAYDVFGYVAPGVLLVMALEWTIGYPHVLGQELKPFAIVAFILITYVAGQLVAEPARTILEDWFVTKVLTRPSKTLFSATGPRGWRRLFSSYFAPLPAVIQERVKKRAAESGVKDTGEPLFLLARYHEETRKNERLMQKLDAFVGMYGFARNMAFVCVLAGVALLVKVLARHGAAHDLTRGVLILGAGVLLLYRYLKFYRQYSDELFNCFGSVKEK